MYRVTYNSDDRQFIVHRDERGLPNKTFHMHRSGLHIYDPKAQEFVFVTTVEGNKLPFSKGQIDLAEKTRLLHASLSFPAEQDFKWILRSNQINDCPVTVQDA